MRDRDPITTHIIRNALISAAMQMKITLTRASFSPVIYEVNDFAVAIYDTKFRLLAQAPSLPLFMGTLDILAREAVAALEEPVVAGDVILYNWPYGTGSHPQDVALVMPVFVAGEQLGYVVAKAHWIDIGGKGPYSTDTTDVFQEGVIYPGLLLCRGGVIDRQLLRLVLANSRAPAALNGDLNAQLSAVRAGARAFERIVAQHGRERFWNAVEHMLDHAEAMARDVIKAIPDGVYSAVGQCDNDGLTTGPVPFDVSVEIAGSNVTVDLTAVPDQLKGPLNTPEPSTISACRIAMAMLTGSEGSPNAGHFRPVTVRTRPGSMFHPLPPAPTFLYGLPALQLIEVIYRAISSAVPEQVPAESGGCLVGLTYWGERDLGGTWIEGSPHPVGQGGSAHGDGGTSMHHAMAGTRIAPIEVWEARNPWIVEKAELATDSAGAGRYRGGCGVDFELLTLADMKLTASVDHMHTAPSGLAGGTSGRANSVSVQLETGRVVDLAKVTGLEVAKGSRILLRTGGGGGYGRAEDRDPHSVANDLRDGLISEEHAERFYSGGSVPRA